MKKVKLFITMFIVIGLTVLGCDFLSPENDNKNVNFTIHNKLESADNIITGVHAKTIVDSDWGPNLISRALSTEQSTKITLQKHIAEYGIFDLKVITNGGREIIKNTLQLKSGSTIEFADDTIIIRNRLESTDNVINRIHIKVSSDTDWGPNLRTTNLTFNNDAKIILLTPINKALHYDVRVITTSNRIIEKTGMLLSTGANIDFTDDFFYIRNSTSSGANYNFNEVHMKESASDDWGANLIVSPIIYSSSGDGRKIILLKPINALITYDVRTKDAYGDTYLKEKIFLANEAKLVFTSADEMQKPRIWVHNLISTSVGSIQVSQIYVRGHGTTNWGTNLISGNLSYNNKIQINLPFPLTQYTSYDVRVYVPSAYYTSQIGYYLKPNIILTQNGDVKFYSSDKE